MSNPATSSAATESNSSFAATLLAAIGGFAIFLLILVVAYLPNKVAAPGDGVKTPAERKAALAELRGKESTAATTYGWVDKDKGVVRLPLDRAIALTIQEHAAK
jgi:lysylphosphatidylglycerol synthetase-like protein (DUF2156 family)